VVQKLLILIACCTVALLASKLLRLVPGQFYEALTHDMNYMFHKANGVITGLIHGLVHAGYASESGHSYGLACYTYLSNIMAAVNEMS
jgi:hypothetical protein